LISVATNSYITTCKICGGETLVTENNRPPYTSQDCYDCGWFNTDQPGYEESGFCSFEDLNEHRQALDYDLLERADFMEIRKRIEKHAISVLRGDEYASIINRVRMS